MPEVGSGPRDSRSHPGSITQQVLPAVIALLVAVSALGVGLIRGSSGPTIFVTATQYGNDAAYCESVSSPGCQLAPAGATWTIPPISSRCTVNGPPGSGLNVPNPPGPTECASWTISFGFNTTDELGVTGMLSTTGPIQVWILPGQDVCGWEELLTHVANYCPSIIHYSEDYPIWDVTDTSASLLNFATLGFNVGSGPDLFPAIPWAIELVDIGTQPVTVIADSDVDVAPS